MNESTFEQPLPIDKAKLAATGHLANRSVVKGKWHIYPEMAAAGLWTTASDLVRFAVGMQEAAAGKSGKILSRELARQMLLVEKGAYGLGVSLDGSGPTLRFSHGGRDEGFDAGLVAYAETGQGAAIMINANDNSRMVPRILEVIARAYQWRDFPSLTPGEQPAAEVKVAEDKLVAYAGRYEFANNQMLSIVAERGHLVTLVDGFPDEEFLPDANDRFHSTERDARITFVQDGGGKVSGILWNAGGRERKVPRIGPLFDSLNPKPDPDPARTEKVVAALKALGQGRKTAADSPSLTPGARADLANGPAMGLANLESLVFLADEDVSARAIERHKGAVSRILHYRLTSEKPARGLLVHMTADGLITDYDIVDD
jgi:hypothetical protein